MLLCCTGLMFTKYLFWTVITSHFRCYQLITFYAASPNHSHCFIWTSGQICFVAICHSSADNIYQGTGGGLDVFCCQYVFPQVPLCILLIHSWLLSALSYQFVCVCRFTIAWHNAELWADHTICVIYGHCLETGHTRTPHIITIKHCDNVNTNYRTWA